MIKITATASGYYEVDTPFGPVQVAPQGGGTIYVTTDQGEPPHITVNGVRIRIASMSLKLENGRYVYEWGTSPSDLNAHYSIQRRDDKPVSQVARDKVLATVPDLVTRWAFHNPSAIRQASIDKLAGEYEGMRQRIAEMEKEISNLNGKAKVIWNQAERLKAGQDPATLYDRPRVLLFPSGEKTQIITFDPSSTPSQRIDEIGQMLEVKQEKHLTRIDRGNGTSWFYNSAKRGANLAPGSKLERMFDERKTTTTGSPKYVEPYELPGLVILARLDSNNLVIGLTDRDIVRELSALQER